MKKIFTLIILCIISINTIHAEISWTLSDDGTLTISGTDMPYYDYEYPDYGPWYSQSDKIKKIIIENGVTNIGNYAFYKCSNLTSVTIPNTVKNIGSYAFMDCSALTSINIPNSVMSINDFAFSNCLALTSVTIPNSVIGIYQGTFSGCRSLTSITIPNSVTFIANDAFYYCASLKSITIPNSVTSIGGCAFWGCSSLTSINIPNSVTTIDNWAFCDCSGLTSINMSNSLTSIGSFVFGGCSGLTSITCDADTPPNCGNNCFSNVDKSIPIYVPGNSIEAYQSANGWRDFDNIQAIPITIADGERYAVYIQQIDGRNIFYTRNFNNTKWQALYIPFSLSYEDWKNDFDVAYINGIRQIDTNDDNVIDETIMDVYRIEEGSLIPNTPYLIRAKTIGEKTISVSNATLYKAEENSIDCSTTIAKYTFTGTYKTIPASTLIENEYYAMGGGSVIMTDGESDLKPFRWYMKIEARSPIYNVASTSNAAKTITINVLGEEGEATGISQMSQNDKTISRIYDLNGRAVNENPLTPGIYIKNGKKLVIK